MASLRFVNSKNLNEYITEENMLTCWGGKDDYQFKFEPSKSQPSECNDNSVIEQKRIIVTKDENHNNTMVISHDKKVRTSDWLMWMLF